MPNVNLHCCRKRKVDFSFVTVFTDVLFTDSLKNHLTLFMSTPKNAPSPLSHSALYLKPLITHSLNLKAYQPFQWSEENVPMLMEMEVSKVSL